MNEEIKQENAEASYKSGVKDLTKTNTRFYALFLLCLLCFGSYFVYDNPAALETKLKNVKTT